MTEENTETKTSPTNWEEMGSAAVSGVFNELFTHQTNLIAESHYCLDTHQGGNAGVASALDAYVRPIEADRQLAGSGDEFYEQAVGATDTFVQSIEAQLIQIRAIVDRDPSSPDNLNGNYENAQYTLKSLLLASTQEQFDQLANELRQFVTKAINIVRNDATDCQDSSKNILQLSINETGRFDWWKDTESDPNHSDYKSQHASSLRAFDEVVHSTGDQYNAKTEFIRSQVTDDNIGPVDTFIADFRQARFTNLTDSP